jgi:hypothetical protein
MNRRTGESRIELPEFREMVAVAKKYLAGECHFSALGGAAMECEFWCRVHDVHPTVYGIARDWSKLADRVWNEWKQYGKALPESEFRAKVAADMGVSLEPTD